MTTNQTSMSDNHDYVERTPEQFVLFVVWGERPEAGDKPCKYSFATQAEANAFLLGIDEATGWFDAAIFDTMAEAEQYLDEEGGKS